MLKANEDLPRGLALLGIGVGLAAVAMIFVLHAL